MLEQQNELAKQKIAVARSEHLPQVGLVGQYGYLNGIELNGRKLLDSWNFLVGSASLHTYFDFGHRTTKIKSARRNTHRFKPNAKILTNGLRLR